MSDDTKWLGSFMGSEIDKLRAELDRALKDAHIAETCAARAEDELNALRADRDALRAALMSTTASLIAAVSLLERGGIKVAPSNMMFMQMLKDYKNSIDGARAAIKGAG